MNASVLLTIFDSVYLLAMAAWVGSVMFLSFGVAPIIFTVLDPHHAAQFVRALFPRYYAWGAICAAIALPALVCGPLTHVELRGPAVGAQALLILAGGALMLYCGNSLTPAINAARDAGPAEKPRFERLHKRSVYLNGVVLLIGIALLIAFAGRPAPRSSGIVEPSPGQLTEGQAKMLRDSAAVENRKREILEKVGGEAGLNTLRKPDGTLDLPR